MFGFFRSLDELLRGKRVGAMTAEGAPVIEAPLGTFLPLAIGLGAVYGFFMGWYRISMRWGTGVADGYLQTIASMVKMPALFLLTLSVTFPSLYVFSALLGSRLAFGPLLRLLVASMVVSLAVAASFGPILAFFTLSTESYPFMVVLNVVFLAISGLVGVGFLLKAFRQLAAPVLDPTQAARASGEEGSGTILGVWILIYGAVGVQMAWLMRPFIGHPNAEFTWFRPRMDNFLVGLWHHLHRLMGG
jgi:hypothetical protein